MFVCYLVNKKKKYALAMVFTYFKRAKFYLNEYNRLNFYLALYLASDIEEDVDEYKYEIFPWALGIRWRQKFSKFLRQRDGLLRRIGYRAIVSRKCCEEVMSLVPDHCIWKRERSEDHGGATRAYLISRSRRFLSSSSSSSAKNASEHNAHATASVDTAADPEQNLPRGPNEKPRPCPLCLVNRSSHTNASVGGGGKMAISSFNPSISKYSAVVESSSSSLSSSSGYHSINSEDNNNVNSNKSSLLLLHNEDDYNNNNNNNNNSTTINANVDNSSLLLLSSSSSSSEIVSELDRAVAKKKTNSGIHFNEPTTTAAISTTTNTTTTTTSKRQSETPRHLKMTGNEQISYGLDVVLSDGGGSAHAPCSLLPSSNKFAKVSRLTRD